MSKNKQQHTQNSALPDSKGLSFHAKIVFPVVAILASFVTIILLIVHFAIERQFHEEETENLFQSQRIFEKLIEIRKADLEEQARELANDVDFKTVVQNGDQKTLNFTINEIIKDLDLTFINITTPESEIISTVVKISDLDATLYNQQYTLHLKRALEGKTITTLADLDGSIFEIATTPIIADQKLIGVISTGRHLDDTMVADFRRLTGCEIAFYSGSRVSVASWQEANKRLSFYRMVEDKSLPFALGDQAIVSPIEKIIVENDHYLGLLCTCSIPDQSEPVRFGLFSSYENQYAKLQHTQQQLIQVGILGICLSGIVAWILTGRALKPVASLQKSIAAMSEGDFRNRAEVTTHDEIGTLALAFNEMSDKLQYKRDEMEHQISKLRDTRARLLQSEKLSALGAFIAGITHEFNNPLTVMVGYAQLLKESDISDDHKDDVTQIIESSERCQGIVQNLLSFARERPAERTLLSLNELVNSSLKFVLYELTANNIKVIKELDPELPLVLADAHQIQQVILNIIKNAEQAMEANTIERMITLRTYSESGSMVRLSIQDSGPGIAPAAMHKLFDPFFTTKEQGKGTGLGLSMSYGIIREHGGEILVENSAGEGARFMIDLPQAPKSDGRFIESNYAEHASRQGQQVAGQKILIVDDEELILKLTYKILNRCGYEVHTTGNGLEALHRIEREHYDIVLSDWKMPGMSGQEFFEQWLDTYPNATTRFIFMTGDVLNEDMQRYIERNGSACLLKPFSLDEFRATLQMLIQSDTH